MSWDSCSCPSPPASVPTFSSGSSRRPNRVDNGLLLRSDLHRLFDRGLVSVDPERLTFEVSDRIRHEYSNGRVYYELAGRPLTVLPQRPDERPSRAFLEHHRSSIYRP